MKDLGLDSGFVLREIKSNQITPQELDEMKDWQKGYQLEYLKEITAEYDNYNKYTDSPFAQFKKNNVADFLDKGSLRKAGDAWINIREAKVRSKITMHGTGPIIGYKEPGDVIFENIKCAHRNSPFP